MSQDFTIFSLRLPSDLRSWFDNEASKNVRTLTAELLIALRERMEREEAKRSRKK